LRPFVPPESAGLVVFLIGMIIGLASLRILLEDNAAGALAADDGTVAGGALAVMIGLNIWNKGRLKLFCILIGMVVGYLLSGAVGLLTLDELRKAVIRPLFSVPAISHLSWDFNWSLVIPFAVSGGVASY
jgi:xanthine permease XanP